MLPSASMLVSSLVGLEQLSLNISVPYQIKLAVYSSLIDKRKKYIFSMQSEPCRKKALIQYPTEEKGIIIIKNVILTVS